MLVIRTQCLYFKSVNEIVYFKTSLKIKIIIMTATVTTAMIDLPRVELGLKLSVESLQYHDHNMNRSISTLFSHRSFDQQTKN